MDHLKVKEQYEKFPYPKSRLFWRPQINSANHASFETGSKHVFQKPASHAGKKILLLGCGTNEPLAMALAHPKAQITAVDISEKSLRSAKLKGLLRGIKNVTYVAQDILEFGKTENKYDYIHSYGVLHHLKNPENGFAAVKKLLAPHGFARIMVYSKSARQRISDVRRFFQLLKIDFNSRDFKKQIQQIMNELAPDHPLRLTYKMHPEIHNTPGLVDAFMHVQETSFELTELEKILSQNKLEIKAWDFSQNVLNLLKDADGKSSEEKIKYLEATDQWPSSFTFWITHEN